MNNLMAHKIAIAIETVMDKHSAYLLKNIDFDARDVRYSIACNPLVYNDEITIKLREDLYALPIYKYNRVADIQYAHIMFRLNCYGLIDQESIDSEFQNYNYFKNESHFNENNPIKSYRTEILHYTIIDALNYLTSIGENIVKKHLRYEFKDAFTKDSIAVKFLKYLMNHISNKEKKQIMYDIIMDAYNAAKKAVRFYDHYNHLIIDDIRQSIMKIDSNIKSLEIYYKTPYNTDTLSDSNEFKNVIFFPYLSVLNGFTEVVNSLRYESNDVKHILNKLSLLASSTHSEYLEGTSPFIKGFIPNEFFDTMMSKVITIFNDWFNNCNSYMLNKVFIHMVISPKLLKVANTLCCRNICAIELTMNDGKKQLYTTGASIMRHESINDQVNQFEKICIYAYPVINNIDKEDHLSNAISLFNIAIGEDIYGNLFNTDNDLKLTSIFNDFLSISVKDSMNDMLYAVQTIIKSIGDQVFSKWNDIDYNFNDIDLIDTGKFYTYNKNIYDTYSSKDFDRSSYYYIAKNFYVYVAYEINDRLNKYIIKKAFHGSIDKVIAMENEISDLLMRYIMRNKRYRYMIHKINSGLGDERKIQFHLNLDPNACEIICPDMVNENGYCSTNYNHKFVMPNDECYDSKAHLYYKKIDYHSILHESIDSNKTDLFEYDLIKNEYNVIIFPYIESMRNDKTINAGLPHNCIYDTEVCDYTFFKINIYKTFSIINRDGTHVDKILLPPKMGKHSIWARYLYDIIDNNAPNNMITTILLRHSDRFIKIFKKYITDDDIISTNIYNERIVALIMNNIEKFISLYFNNIRYDGNFEMHMIPEMIYYDIHKYLSKKVKKITS